jgi:hypothetical protein
MKAPVGQSESLESFDQLIVGHVRILIVLQRYVAVARMP